MTIEDVLKELLGKHFSKVSKFCLDFMGGKQNEDGIRKTFEYLQKLGIKTEKIAMNACLLGRNSGTIKDHYDKLISLGISPQKTATNTSLLGRNSEIIQKHYDKLINLGISPQKIVMNAPLLTMNPETIKDHYDKLIRLGISPQKIITQTSLLFRNPESIQDYYNYLTNIIKLEKNKILDQPQLLLFNLDAFAKKLRIFKLDILGLRRNNAFNPNEYTQFYLTSPATLLAKKNYCIDNRIDYRNNLLLLKRLWRKLIKRVEKKLSDAEAEKKGKRITLPCKQRYDNWMREYKNWCHEFALRRGRRLIIRV